jgi:cation transport ATPase
MAKTKYKGYNPADTAQQQENIRKAKGNPNKNIHHKKNGSNYGGYASAVKKQEERRARTEKKRESIFDMNRTQRIVFGVLITLAVAGMILTYTVFKDSPAAPVIPSLTLGLMSGFLAYIGYTNRAKRSTTFQTILMVVLAILGVVYTTTGVIGLINLLNG